MVNKKRSLKNISNIISGYTFRKKITPDDTGYLLILQSKNITDNLIVSDKELTKVFHKTIRTNSFVRNNDIVISSRGSFRSAVIKSTKQIIASSSVYILRLTDNQVFPEFLSLYLNSSIGKKNLLTLATGSTIKTILINDLGTLKIPIPSLSVQKSIVKLYLNQKSQSKLLEEKVIINSNILDGALQQL